MKTRQMTPLSTFSALFVTFIFIFENGQDSFSYGLPFGLFWSLKCLNFEYKLPIWIPHHIFLEIRHPEVTKNPYVLPPPPPPPPKGCQKKVSPNGLIPVCRGAYISYIKINPPLSENYLNP